MNQPPQPPIAIVLAAGKGTRMQSDLPKVLFPVCDRPLIRYVLDALREAGVEKLIVVVGYRSALVRQALSDYDNIEFVEQTEQLGTGHAVMVCRDRISDFQGPVFVVAGDSPMLQASSLRTLLERYRQSGAVCLLGTLLHPDPSGLGRIVRDENGDFTGIVEDKDCTPAQRQINEVNMSTYLIDCQQMLSALQDVNRNNQQGEYYITDVPGILIARGLVVRAEPVLQACEALSVNTIEQLQQVEQEMLRIAEARQGQDHPAHGD
jgi:bifunctional UDP-N-acetylglucosamine pyrophosphorylase/glucosamine-1-phosphate N-acetyltransferase/UDP-N-acetylglucosamine pyrophosphorylase